jgi:cell shape-determining protein MreD
MSTILVLLGAIVAIGVQMRFDLPGHPDLAAAVVLVFAAKASTGRSCFVATAIGLFGDACSTMPLGAGAMCMTTAAFVVSSLAVERTPIAATALTAVVLVMALAVVEKLLGRVDLSLGLVMLRSLMAGVATAVVVGIMLVVVLMLVLLRRRHAYPSVA